MSDPFTLTTEAKSFAKLEALETRVESGLTNFIDVGNALTEIRDRKLYQVAGHTAFEDYCRIRWGMAKSKAYYLINAADTVSTIVDKSKITTESQARELSRVEPARRQEVVEKASAATGGKITAASLREAVRTELVAEKAKAPVAKFTPVVFTEARELWEVAKGRLDNIRKNDPERISVLQEVIQYAQGKLDDGNDAGAESGKLRRIKSVWNIMNLEDRRLFMKWVLDNTPKQPEGAQ